MADLATWSKRVTEWRASGQTAKQFAASRGFARTSLMWWASRLKREEPAAALVRVIREDTGSRESPIELEAGGVRIRVRSGFDRGALAAVLAIVRGGTAA